LGRHEEALEHYRAAMARDRERSGINSGAACDFGRLVVELQRDEVLAEAIAALATQLPSPFPAHAYVDNGVRAVHAARAGDHESAREFAQGALRVAAIRDTGLSHGRGALGTVQDGSSRFHAIVAALAEG
jgi:hypothetical protein